MLRCAESRKKDDDHCMTARTWQQTLGHYCQSVFGVNSSHILLSAKTFAIDVLSIEVAAEEIAYRCKQQMFFWKSHEYVEYGSLKKCVDVARHVPRS